MIVHPRHPKGRSGRHHGEAPADVGMRLDLTAAEVQLLREALTAYLDDYRREVAGTENPSLRAELNRRQRSLEDLLGRLAAGQP
jgi:hypothetical protein